MPFRATQSQFMTDLATSKARIKLAVGGDDGLPVNAATGWKADVSGNCFVNCTTIKPIYDTKGITQLVAPGQGHGFNGMINSTQVGTISLF